MREAITWVEAARRSPCGVAVRREGDSLLFAHPGLGAHLGLFGAGLFVKMRFRDSLLEPWEPLDIASEEGLLFLRALIGGFNDLTEI